MASRDDILRAVRARPVPPAELPDLQGPWICYADRCRQFASVLESVGGRCVFVADASELNRELEKVEAYTAAKKIVSLVPCAGRPNVDLVAIADPHQLEDVDFALLPGQFGVAENGAVWVTDAGLKHRVVYFLVQHLALVVPSESIVDNMHQAYERLSFSGAGFGAFISGPSKTADIEQSLVIGAHGPRSLTVFVLAGSISDATAATPPVP
jgi:L-lactate dehydrogenase complex protein LldG